MDKTYLTLFTELCRATSVLAERVYDYDLQKDDKDAAKAAETMRDDYNNLYDNFKTEDYVPTRSDFAKLLVGAIVVAKNLENKIANERKALQGYTSETIPKLNRIIDETENDEDALNLANELFQISENQTEENS